MTTMTVLFDSICIRQVVDMQGVGDLMTDPQMHTINQQFGLGENNEQYSTRLIWFFGISCIPFGP
jgi:hypothetical protein